MEVTRWEDFTCEMVSYLPEKYHFSFGNWIMKMRNVKTRQGKNIDKDQFKLNEHSSVIIKNYPVATFQFARCKQINFFTGSIILTRYVKGNIHNYRSDRRWYKEQIKKNILMRITIGQKSFSIDLFYCFRAFTSARSKIIQVDQKHKSSLISFSNLLV